MTRYDAHGLGEELGARWVLVAQEREEHHTPGGGRQPFTWAAFRRQS